MKYKHGDIRLVGRQSLDPTLTSHDEAGDNPSTQTPTASHGEATTTSAAADGNELVPGDGQPTTDRPVPWTKSITTGRMGILDVVPKGYRTPPPTSSHSGRNYRHHGPLVQRENLGSDRPSTTGTAYSRTRPFQGSLLAGALPSASPSGRRNEAAAARLHYVERAAGGGTGGYQPHLQKHGRPPAPTTDEYDMVGRWDYASSEDYASAAASGFFNPGAATAGTDTSATVTSAHAYSVDSSTGVGGFNVGGDADDEQARVWGVHIRVRNIAPA